jgi:ABC-2 type transport system permease protein
MNKILLVAKRDFIASVRTKAFVFALVAAPVLFGGSFIGLALMRGKPDIKERRIAIVDHTSAVAAAVIDAARERNARELRDKVTGEQVKPVYSFEAPPPDTANPRDQLLALSGRVRSHDLYAFVEIAADALDPSSKPRDDRYLFSWYSNESGLAEAQRWISGPLNDGLRRVMLTRLGVGAGHFSDLLGSGRIESMKLVSKDDLIGGRKADIEAAIPITVTILLAMIVMMTAGPMLPAIAEDKMQRVYEMLLASATPYELIAGKVLAAVGRSLVSSVVYIGGAIFLLTSMAMIGVAPFSLMPWFVIYLVAETAILCAFGAALGAACGTSQDAQSLVIILLMPIMVPMFLLVPVLQQPNGALATAMSLIPPFTPVLMLLRQATPGGVPAWQPWAGLVGALAAAFATSWMAARIFRVGILMHGKPPNLAELVRWAVRG